MLEFSLSVVTYTKIGGCTLFDGVCSESVKTGMFAVPTMWLQKTKFIFKRLVYA